MMENIKVLFVDDDMLFSHIVMNALLGKGYEVNCQHSTIGLLEIIRQFGPDIILLDVEIGNEDGIGMVPKIQLVAPDIPILFISSHKESCEVQRALEKGAITYLMKPLDTDVIIAHIERHARPHNHTSITIGTLKLNLRTRMLYQGNAEIKRLSKLEFGLLRLLNDHKNQIVSLEEICMLWNDNAMNEHSLYNYIGKLRKLLAIDDGLSIDSLKNGYALREKH